MLHARSSDAGRGSPRRAQRFAPCSCGLQRRIWRGLHCAGHSPRSAISLSSASSMRSPSASNRIARTGREHALKLALVAVQAVPGGAGCSHPDCARTTTITREWLKNARDFGCAPRAPRSTSARIRNGARGTMVPCQCVPIDVPTRRILHISPRRGRAATGYLIAFVPRPSRTAAERAA